MKKTLAERFWERVDRDGPTTYEDLGPCWLWTGAKIKNGYGVLAKGGGRNVYAHRLAYEIAHGPIPPGHQVQHRCDTRACVRDTHLVLGLPADNSRAMVERGRQRNGRPPLRAGPSLWAQARVAAGLSQKDASDLSGVSKATISFLESGRLIPKPEEAEALLRVYTG